MSRGGTPLVIALLAVSALGVARTQPRLARITHDVKERDDVAAIPPPAQLKSFALGYDAAMVDILWAKLLVDFGLRWHEKRSFHPDPYVDAILYLEPTYGPMYRFVDTILCYHPLHADEADARKTRAILEKGTHERPGDFEVWQEYGQFLAFLGVSYLSDEAEKDRWRHDGALAMVKAVELGGDPTGSLIASTILGRSGERAAAIESLKRTYATIDDPQMREEIIAKLARFKASEENEAEEQALKSLETMWREDWPFLTRGEFLLLGPAPDPAACAGPDAADDAMCSRDWDALLAERKRRGL